MRRAISWVYCAPKSRIRILSLWMSVMSAVAWAWMRAGSACGREAGASPCLVVRRLLGDLHVVHVALARAGVGDAHELGPGAHVLDGGATDVTHGGVQPAHQ